MTPRKGTAPALGSLSPEQLRKRAHWPFHVERYADVSRPVDCGPVWLSDLDSDMPRCLDMPVWMPFRGPGPRIPEPWRELEALVYAAMGAETATLTDGGWVETSYVYLTVDTRRVPHGTPQRRPGWHADAFVVDMHDVQRDVVPETLPLLVGSQGQATRWIERTYIAYDCLPTLFIDGPTPIPPGAVDGPEVTDAWERAAERHGTVTYPNGRLLQLTPYDVHSAAVNTAGYEFARTFVRVAISPYRHNREGNTHNDLYEYDWPLVPRPADGSRAHPAVP